MSEPLPTLPDFEIDPARALPNRLPTPVYTPEQKRERDAQQPVDEGYYGRTLVDLGRTAWATSDLYRQAEGSFSRTLYQDPNFKLDEDRIQKYGEGIPTDWLGEFASAESDADAQRIRGNLLRRAESHRRIGELGYTGRALEFGAAVLDPVNIAAAAMSGGLGATASASRIANFARAGFINAATAVPITAYQQSQDPEEHQARDLLLPAVMAFGLGGVIGARQGSKLRQASLSLQKQVELEEAKAAGATVTDAGKTYFADQVAHRDSNGFLSEIDTHIDDVLRTKAFDTAAERLSKYEPDEVLSRSQVDEVLDGTGYRTGNQGWPTAGDMAGYLDQMRERVPGTTPDTPGIVSTSAIKRTETPPSDIQGLGAASPSTINQPGPAIVRKPGELDLSSTPDRVPLPTAIVAGHARPGIAAQMGVSDNPSVNVLGQMLVRDNLLREGGGAVAQSATEEVARTVKTTIVPYERTHVSAFKQYMKAKGVALWNIPEQFRARAAFNKEAFKAAYSGINSSLDPTINAAADAWRAVQKAMRDKAERFGVKGFDQIPVSDTYVPHLVDVSKIHQTIAAHGEAEALKWLEGAIGAKNPSLTGKALSDKAKQYLTNLRQVDKGLTFIEKEAALRDILTPDELMAGPAKPSVPGVPPRAKPRQLLDESYVHTTPDGQNIGFGNFFEDDLETIAHIYARQMAGHAAMAEVYRGMSIATGTDIADDAGLIAKIAADATNLNVKPNGLLGPNNANDVANVEAAIGAVRGRPTGGTGVFSEMARAFQQLNFVTRGGKFAFAQVGDIGKILGEGGVEAAWRQMPVLPSLLVRMKDGQASNDLINEIITLWGPGQSRLTRQVIHRIGEDAGGLTNTGRYIEPTLRRLGRTMSDVSGLHWIERFTHESAAVVAVQKFATMAKTGKPINEARLASIGLTPARAAEVSAEIMAHSKFGPRGQLLEINIDQWGNAQAASDFIVGVEKWAQKAAQVNNVGEYAKWMTTDMGRVLAQFRTFGASAWEISTLGELQQIKQKNFASFGTLTLPVLFAGIGYMARIYSDSIGRPDAKEYRAKMLTPEKIVGAGINYAPGSSLVPMMVDASMIYTGHDPVFGFARTSGLQADPLFGNPMFDLMSKGPRLLPALSHTVQGNPSKADSRTIRSFTPLQNMFPVKNILDHFEAGFPDRREP